MVVEFLAECDLSVIHHHEIDVLIDENANTCILGIWLHQMPKQIKRFQQHLTGKFELILRFSSTGLRRT